MASVTYLSGGDIYLTRTVPLPIYVSSSKPRAKSAQLGSVNMSHNQPPPRRRQANTSQRGLRRRRRSRRQHTLLRRVSDTRGVKWLSMWDNHVMVVDGKREKCFRTPRVNSHLAPAFAVASKQMTYARAALRLLKKFGVRKQR